jgi:plastocyanin
MIRANLILAALSIVLVSIASSQILTAEITSASALPLTSTAELSSTKQVNMTELTSSISGFLAPTTRTFNIYTTHVPGFNEIKGVQKANLTDDQYSLQTILVNQGDKVVVNLYNMEAPSGDRHSFTIGPPYNVNIDTAPTHNGSATFVADHPGIFKFYCEYHIPSMVGQLVVLANKS